MNFRSNPKALVLDRDGTIIEHVPYLHATENVVLLPGVRDGLRLAMSAGLRLFLHTNQSGVGRGMFTIADAESCTARMIDLLDLGVAPFTRICTAPEHPSEPSLYRKPSPRFAQEIMQDFGYEASEIWYVGDRASDMATAEAAGTFGVGVDTGLQDLTAELLEQRLMTYPVFPSFDLAIAYICKQGDRK
jgi:D-glycero-D-manno-heptose 1,7-bisphosphate phosphatase